MSILKQHIFIQQSILQKKKEGEELEKQRHDFEKDEVLREKRREEAKRIAEKEAEKKRVSYKIWLHSIIRTNCAFIMKIDFKTIENTSSLLFNLNFYRYTSKNLLCN